MMKWAFLISGIIELLGAIILYFYPELVFSQDAYFFTRLYAVAISVIAVFNFSCFRLGPDMKIWKTAVLTMMYFHAALAMICYSADDSSFPLKLNACLTHLALFVLFFISYMKDLKPDSE